MIINLNSPELIESNQRIIDFINMEKSIKKNIFYSKMPMHFCDRSIYIDDNSNIYYSHRIKVLKKSANGYYLKTSQQYGFTCTSKGSVRFWFGSSISKLPYDDIRNIFQALNIDWISNDLTHYLEYITGSLLGKILVKKITNVEDLSKAILKLYRVKASHKLFRECILLGLHKRHLLKAVYSAVNLDNFFKFYIGYMKKASHQNITLSDIDDMFQQANILERKIDFNWSEKRFQQVHTDWTLELLSYESDNKSTEKIEWLSFFDDILLDNQYVLPCGGILTLLDNEKDIFIQSSLQKHCVYSSYYTRVESKVYIVFDVKYNDLQYTAGFNVNYHGSDIHSINIDQCRGKCNIPAPEILINGLIDFKEIINTACKMKKELSMS